MNIRGIPNPLAATKAISLKRTYLRAPAPALTSLPAKPHELWFAYAVISLSALICIAVIPFAHTPFVKIVAFIPSYESALAISDLITAVLLFGRATQRHSSACLALACGYFFSAAIIVPHALTFPGIFSQTGLLGANDQTTAWLYVFWHGGFPIFTLGYVFFPTNDHVDDLLHRHSGLVVFCSVACVGGVVVGLTLLATLGHGILPIIIKGGDYSALVSTGVSPTIFALNIAAFVALRFRRKLAVLDLWLMVVSSVYVLDVLLSTIVSSSRYDVGWYAGRIYLLIASCCLLIVLLFEFIRLQARLSESEERFRMLVRGVKDYAILMLDSRGSVVSWNEGAEQIKGYTSAEIIGEHFSRFYTPEDQATGKPALALLQAAAEGQYEDEGWRLRKDNSRFWASVSITPLVDEKGELRGYSKITRDVTARKTAEAHLSEKLKELSRSNEELGQFASVASHDLQEPLRMVSQYLTLLSRRYKGKLDADADEFIAFAVDGASRMQRLIRDLLTYSRLGTATLKLHSTSSEKSLQQALVNLHGVIEASGALVTYGPLPAVMADDMQLSQVFQNLVGNAIKYQKTGIPKIHVTAAINNDKKWRFSVQDNGIGIEAKDFERIFGMFQRLHGGGEYEGTGIGLAICKKIVERHGGGLSVDSQAGHGSTFHFTLAEGAISV